MADHLPIPPELEHLIEKRDEEAQRRQREQRSGIDQRNVDLGPLGAIESVSELDDISLEERRKQERREAEERRKQERRKKS